MRRLVLFSLPLSSNFKKILNLVFAPEIKDKKFAYMPSDGANCPKEYIEQWNKYAVDYNADFKLIDNSKVEVEAKVEIKHLQEANILVITGGNTFKLLFNLRRSGLDNAIKEFVKKDDFVISGFSAGALVLTPTINVCQLPNIDENTVGLTDLTGLNIVDFEVFPHYDRKLHSEILNEYRKSAKHQVKEISDDDYLELNL